MNNETQPAWMLSPKRFIRLLGAEYQLVRDTGILKRFYLSALLIIIILMLTWVSIQYALDLLFHTFIIELSLAIFFCLLFLSIYIFLLNTFAKENRGRKRILNISNIIRIGFVVFMGVLVAQPLVILLYADKLTPEVGIYKQLIFAKHKEQVTALTKDETEKLLIQKARYTGQKQKSGTQVHDSDIYKIENKLQSIHDKAASINHSAQVAIEQNSFFLFRISTVNRQYPLSWVFSLFIVLLFLLPGYLIYTIPSQHEYFSLKKAREKELITVAYAEFRTRYTLLFQTPLEIFSRFEDPPFNTTRKQLPTSASMKEFFQKYIDNV